MSHGRSTAEPDFPLDMVSQWPLEAVLAWLAANSFSAQWQDTLKALQLQGDAFLDLGRRSHRGNLSTMHKQVYPHLKYACLTSNSVWDPQRERNEGKRLRRLIRHVVNGTSEDQLPTTSAPPIGIPVGETTKQTPRVAQSSHGLLDSDDDLFAIPLSRDPKPKLPSNGGSRTTASARAVPPLMLCSTTATPSPSCLVTVVPGRQRLREPSLR